MKRSSDDTLKFKHKETPGFGSLSNQITTEILCCQEESKMSVPGVLPDNSPNKKVIWFCFSVFIFLIYLKWRKLIKTIFFPKTY